MDHCQTFLNACRNGQKNIVRIFIERGGIDLDRRDAEGNTALHYVCREGFRDLAVLLLDRGADPSLTNNRGGTPLHAAARKGNREILARLIDAGADPDAVDNEGCTPLMRLLENHRTDAALWLIDRGADTEVTDRSGHRALDYATVYGLREAVARLSRPDDAVRDAEGNTPLHQAVCNDQAEVVRTLLAASKAQLDAPNDAGETPLLMACGRGNLHIARMLLAAGADVNRSLPCGLSPLHRAGRATVSWPRRCSRPARRLTPATEWVKRLCFWQHAPGTTRLCVCSWNAMPKSMWLTISSTRPSIMPASEASWRLSNCCSSPVPKDKIVEHLKTYREWQTRR